MSSTHDGRSPDSDKRNRGCGPDQPGSMLWETFDNLRTEFERRMSPRMGRENERGDVRVAILRLLADVPMHGYQIIQEIEKRSEGAWKPTPGSVYPTLQLLADEGLIRAEEIDGKKTYSLTEVGTEEARTIGHAPWETTRVRDSARSSALPRAAAKLAEAVVPIARGGTAEQVDEAVAVIDDARRKLYTILAQD